MRPCLVVWLCVACGVCVWLKLLSVLAVFLCVAGPPAYPSQTFTCENGDVISGAFVNDNFCDCGSDEAGTGACSSQPFVCQNVGASSKAVHPSLVGDGICDCCDGSDEWATTAPCMNTCFEEERRQRCVGVLSCRATWRLQLPLVAKGKGDLRVA